MTDRAFTTEERLQLDAAVRDITAGTQRIDEFCASLREDMVSNAAERRRIAVNKLSYVVAGLEPTAISGTQVQNILIFLAERLSDTGHLSELLVTAIHHLYFAKKFEQSLEFDRLFHLLFDDNAVQSFVQADRMRFLEIFEDIVKHHFGVVRNAGLQLVTVYSNAAAGERDPRCLLLAFRVFAAIMERVDLGPMMKDMFELVACYYPLEYSPKRSDSSAISTSTLATACERCLLASGAFSFYTYQLIAEKMLDEETVVKYERKLEICRFLEDACARFGAPALIPLLDNFLPAFRMIALNPNQKSRDRRPVEIVGSSLAAVIRTLDASTAAAAKSAIKSAASEMIENCEPFVMQPEMGLAAKALLLLERMAAASSATAAVLVPKVFYWIYALIAGLTVKNPSNKEEIVEETLPDIPNWIQVAQTSGTLPEVLLSLPALFDAIHNTEGASRDLKLGVLCRMASLLLEAEGIEVADELRAKFQRVFEELLEPRKALNAESGEIFSDFLRRFAAGSAERIEPLVRRLRDEQKWTQQDFLYCAALIRSPIDECEWFGHFLDRLTSAGKSTQDVRAATPHLLTAFRKLADGTSGDLGGSFALSLLRRLFAHPPQSSDNQREVGSFLQEVGALLSVEQRKESLDACLKQLDASPSEAEFFATLTMIASFCLLDHDPQTARSLLEKLRERQNEENLERLRPFVAAFFFALRNRGDSTAFERQRPEFAPFEWELRIVECRLEMLVGPKFPTEAVTKVLDEAPAALIPALLDFDTPLTDPVRCDFKRPLMWAQRLLVQFVPFFSDHFKRRHKADGESTGDEERRRRGAIVGLVAPILQLAKRVPIPMTAELRLLFPIVIEALRRAEVGDGGLLLLLDVTNQLLQTAAFEDFAPDLIGELSLVMERFLRHAASPPAVVFAALQVLEALAKRAPSQLKIFRWEATLGALQHVAHSPKRIVRQKAAIVRNLWQLIPV